MSKILTSVLAAAAMSLPALAMAADYQIDTSHSNASFKVRHMMVSTVQGEFGKLTGTASYDPKNPEKIAIDAVIDATTINTREPKRDAHLKSPDFFDVEKHPTLTFKSKSAKAKGPGKLEVTGDLTMHGVTKPVTFLVEGLDQEVTDPWGGSRLGGTATTKINRKDFGLNWNKALEAGGVMVSDEVSITVDVELVKQAPAKSAEK
ncbi:YceI family protein [Vulgatibacter incomptus]|uniref:Lipid/polyisoprenoid-binding YceI-like domain-containing protein n=1 Tax=Vulgatibacter incomptus TaxID=1391653 RepID=A0A0K1PAY9_9BACT|nr:YceI family protein [Vulgatibacter incomptus]AKU90690.1 hypothetical protein AKJ08_1077 [Vulgatibacter incomptus]